MHIYKLITQVDFGAWHPKHIINNQILATKNKKKGEWWYSLFMRIGLMHGEKLQTCLWDQLISSPTYKLEHK